MTNITEILILPTYSNLNWSERDSTIVSVSFCALTILRSATGTVSNPSPFVCTSSLCSDIFYAGLKYYFISYCCKISFKIMSKLRYTLVLFIYTS